MTPLRVVFAGTPDVAVPTLEALARSSHQVVGVITRPDAPAGRGRRMRPSPVASAAISADLPLVRPATLSGGAFDDVLDEWSPDLVVVVAYGLLIPERLLGQPRAGWINAHFSALPRWRGAAPVQHAIAAGDSTIAVTTFRIDPGLDTGPILRQSEAIDVGNREDAGHLLGRLADVAARVVVQTVDGLAQDALTPTPQPAVGITYAPRITSDDARIDWQLTVEVVDRWIRACTPAPGAWSSVVGSRLRIGTPTSVVRDLEAVPGAIIVEKSRVLVGSAGGCVELGLVQPTGKKAMPAADWARGFHGAPPARFDT